MEDIISINNELKSYSDTLASLPQIIAANKTDLMSEEEIEERIADIRKTVGEDTEILPISAATGTGIKELLDLTMKKLDEIGRAPVIYEPEFVPEREEDTEPVSVFFDEEDGIYRIEGSRVDRMLGYTNIEDEKGFEFFQKFMKDNGIIDRLKELGISEGDTVGIYNHEFEYYDE